MRVIDMDDLKCLPNGSDLTASETNTLSTPCLKNENAPKRKRKFNVTPVNISNENISIQLHATSMTPEILISDFSEFHKSRSGSFSSAIHEDDQARMTLLSTPSSSLIKVQANPSENEVPSSLAPLVFNRQRKISSTSQYSPSTVSGNPFDQINLVPHGVTIPPLHLSEPVHKQMLNNLLRVSEKNLHYGTTDGKRVKLYSADSLQLLETESTKDSNWSTLAEKIPTYNPPEEKVTRQVWDSKLYFILSCIGSCVGIGSFWRVPYLCLVYGRAAFLLPYLIIFLTSGIPLMLAEVAIGQFTQKGPVQAFGNICPLMKGVGVGLLFSSLFSSVYYSLIFSESVLSLEITLTETKTPCNVSKLLLCSNQQLEDKNLLNSTKNGVMDMDTFNHIEPGNETYIIVFCALLVSWIFVFMALRNSVRSVGKMTRVTATLPFVLITAFVARAVTLPGAYSGLQYLFTPDWNVLRSGEVWANAAVQVLLSLNIGLGSSITFSSYNKFRNNFTTDVWIISIVSCMSTLLAVLMVFSSIGNIVHELGINIENVNFRGVDLAFVVYPRILLRLPQRHIWTAIYFLLLLLLSLDSQLATAEVLVTTLFDYLEVIRKPNFRFQFLNKFFKNRKYLALGICILCMVFSLPFVMQGHEVAPHLNSFEEMNVALLLLTVLEIATLVWLYGTNRLQRLILQVTSRPSPRYYYYCWGILTPLSFIGFLIMAFVAYDFNYGADLKDGSTRSAFLLSFCMATMSIIPVPIYAFYSLFKAEGSFREKLNTTLTPKIEIKNLHHERRKAISKRLLEWSSSSAKKFNSRRKLFRSYTG